MIEVFKIVHNFYDSGAVINVNFNPLSVTRGKNLNFRNLCVITI